MRGEDKEDKAAAWVLAYQGNPVFPISAKGALLQKHGAWGGVLEPRRWVRFLSPHLIVLSLTLTLGESLLQQSGIFFVGVRQHAIAVAWLR